MDVTDKNAITPNARTSGIKIDRQVLKALNLQSDLPGLLWLGLWATLLAATGVALWASLGTWWAVPATFLFGSVLALPGYALSHECAHGTAFKTGWLNETVFWISSLIYLEPPHHRRIAHGKHHSHTWVQGLDAQITYQIPMTFKGWLLDITYLWTYAYDAVLLARNAFGIPDDTQRAYCSASDLRRIGWESRVFLLIYGALGAVVWMGYWWPVTFLLLPRLAGGIAQQIYTIIQHVEMQPNTLDIKESTRSFRTPWLSRFLYMNMNYHLEHHLFPSVPFHRLPELSKALDGQLPEPDPGLFRTNLEVLSVVIRRSLGRSTKASSIRQAPSMAAPAPAE